MTTRISQRVSPAPDDHHLRPLITYESPSRSMRVEMLVASDDATAGSVMQKAERISPSSNGCSQRSRFVGLAKRSRISIFPVSGAEQLNTSEDQATPPMISHRGA